MNIKNTLTFITGLIIGLILSFLIYKTTIVQTHVKQLKQLESIINTQNKTIEKLGLVEKTSIKNEIENHIKNKK